MSPNSSMKQDDNTNQEISDNQSEATGESTLSVTGVLNPNNQYNIH